MLVPFRPHALLILVAAVRAALPFAGAQSSPNLFHDGDRWCVVGDSITHTGKYHHYISLYYLTRFPTQKILAINCGLSGDTAAGALRRFSWDIATRQPTVATVMLGMNDVGRGLYDPDYHHPDVGAQRRKRLDSYEQNIRKLVTELQNLGTRVVLVTPSIFDQSVELPVAKSTGVDDALTECGNRLETVAHDCHCAVIDLHGPMLRINQDHQRTNPKFTLVGSDRIHPGAPGHLVMACLFLEAQGAPKIVSDLSLDAAVVRVIHESSGHAEFLAKSGDTLAFTWSENALPFPIDPLAAEAREWVPITAALNQETLRVHGLREGIYSLSIDGINIRQYSARELDGGINLAEEQMCPQYQQAMIVEGLLSRRTKLYAEELRDIALFEHQAEPAVHHPSSLDEMQPYLRRRLDEFQEKPPLPFTRQVVEGYAGRKVREAELLAQAAQFWEEAYRAAVPHSHRFLLTRITAPTNHS